VAAGLGVALVAVTLSSGRYWRWERVVLGLAIFNGLFLAAAVMARPHWGPAARSLATFSPFPGGDLNTLLLLVASTIGATVTPWMLFFQQSASADKGLTHRDIAHGRLDTVVGGAAAALFGCGAFIVGTRLAGHPGAGVQGLAGAGFPSALAHVSGPAVGAVFALGLIEAGAVAVLTIGAATAYSAGECIGSTHSFNNRPRSAVLFYAANITSALIAAGVVLIPGAPLLSIALNANVLATVLVPVTLVFVIVLATDRELMGARANRVSLNVVAAAVVIVVAGCGAAYGVDSFLQAAHLIPGG
jgi:Mn2+/Fe2+ NRAMP family transporter